MAKYAMEKKSPPAKLFEDTILEDTDLVRKIKSAVPGQPMSADQFTAWLSAQ